MLHLLRRIIVGQKSRTVIFLRYRLDRRRRGMFSQRDTNHAAIYFSNSRCMILRYIFTTSNFRRYTFIPKIHRTLVDIDLPLCFLAVPTRISVLQRKVRDELLKGVTFYFNYLSVLGGEDVRYKPI